MHDILDNAFDEDRLRIRTGHGPVNTTRLRRFAIGLIKAGTTASPPPCADSTAIPDACSTACA